MLTNVVCVCVCVLLCFVCGLCQLYEGSSCVGESDGMKGQCVGLHRCLSVVYDLKRKIHPQICSFSGRDPIICCTDCVLVNDTSNVLVDGYGSYYFKTGEKAADSGSRYVEYNEASLGGLAISYYLNSEPRTWAVTEKYYGVEECLEQMLNINYPCSTKLGLQKTQLPEMDCYSYEKPYVAAAVGGHDALKGEYPHMPGPSLVRRRRHVFASIRPAAIGGVDAFIAQFPHMALLGYGDELATAQWLCGGSVISDRFILTAAHCISSSDLGPITYVALGILRRTDPPEQWQRYRVKRIIPHPQYKAPIKYHDIALLETDTKIKFNRNVLPACLNTGDSGTEYARATGWGALGHRQALADTLQVVNLQQFSDEECAEMFPSHRHLQNGYDKNTQACYGEKSKIIDTCEGDSGGPLQISSEFGSCIYKIIGVTSFGRACGFEGNAGMYTRVSYYVPWIESIVWP